MKKKRFSLKKGVSIAETVIALAVIAIVSIMAVTVCTTSIKNEQKNLRDFEIRSLTETAIECFEFADTEEDFGTLFANANTVTLGYNERTEFFEFIIQEQNFKMTIEILKDLSEIKVVATDNEQEIIYQTTYTKK